jgi:hypothetical protein
LTTSGITSLPLVAQDVITFALRKLAVVPLGQLPPIAEIEPLLGDMNLMIKGWETTGPRLWTKTDGSVAITPLAQSYSLTADNPLRLEEVRFQYSDGHQMPMIEMSRVQYKTLPLKNSQGFSTQWYFDPQETSQTLYVWPILANPTTELLAYTFQRRFQMCQKLTDSIDIAQEWLLTVGYSFAEMCIPNYGIDGEAAARIEQRAQGLREQAKAFDREPFVQFLPQYQFGGG